MFREHFWYIAACKLIEKVELTKKATDETPVILCERYKNCLDIANLCSRIIKPSTKTFVFRMKLVISIKRKIYVNIVDFIENLNSQLM